MVPLMEKVKIRLYVDQPCLDQPLGPGQSVSLTRDQAHYLFGVMRLAAGAHLLVFDGHGGEYLAEVMQAGKCRGSLRVLEQTRPLQMPPDLWLLFAPIKKARTDFIVEKAAELGAARICPIHSERTNAGRIHRDCLQAHAIKAVEQCGGTFVPEVCEMRPLSAVLESWPADRKLVFCDEDMVGARARLDAASGDEHDVAKGDEWAILIGPESGFSPEERTRLRALPFVIPISLGPRILRADTAAVAALTLWQSMLGDW